MAQWGGRQRNRGFFASCTAMQRTNRRTVPGLWRRPDGASGSWRQVRGLELRGRRLVAMSHVEPCRERIRPAISAVFLLFCFFFFFFFLFVFRLVGLAARQPGEHSAADPANEAALTPNGTAAAAVNSRLPAGELLADGLHGVLAAVGLRQLFGLDQSREHRLRRVAGTRLRRRRGRTRRPPEHGDVRPVDEDKDREDGDDAALQDLGAPHERHPVAQISAETPARAKAAARAGTARCHRPRSSADSW